MQIDKSILLTLAAFLVVTTASPLDVTAPREIVGVDIAPPPKEHSVDTMLVNDSVYPKDKVNYITGVSSGKCIEVKEAGSLKTGLRPTDDIWCTIYSRKNCTIDNMKDKKKQQFIGFVAPGVRRWAEQSSWWAKEGYGWTPNSFQCFKKGSKQVGL